MEKQKISIKTVKLEDICKGKEFMEEVNREQYCRFLIKPGKEPLCNYSSMEPIRNGLRTCEYEKYAGKDKNKHLN